MPLNTEKINVIKDESKKSLSKQLRKTGKEEEQIMRNEIAPRSTIESHNISVYKKKNYTSYELHRRDYYEIILFDRCRGVCILNGNPIPVQDTCAFFLTPKDYHEAQTENLEESLSYILSFTKESIDDSLLPVCTSPRVLHSPVPSLKVLVERMYWINCSSREPLHKQFMLKQILNAILAEVTERGVEVETKQHYMNPAIEEAILYLTTNISRDISLQKVAQKCCLSPAYFSAVFKKETGKTMTKWVNDTRIGIAQTLLQGTSKNILDISLECGYSTLTHFIKTFKKTVGITPSEYRRRYQLENSEPDPRKSRL